MTGLLLLVTFVVCVCTSGYTAYLIHAAKITEPLRTRVRDYLNTPQQDLYQAQLDDYRDRIHEALATDQPIPNDPPPPPADAFPVQLLGCRSCVGMWTSLLIAIVARAALTVPYPPLWTAIPLHPLDILILPGWALATAYAVHWLAAHE